MSFLTILYSIVIMGSIMGVGVILSRFITFNNDTRHLLVTIIVNIAMPCFIISSIFHFSINAHLLHQISIVFLTSLGFNILGITIGWLVAKSIKRSEQNQKEIAILSGLGNTGLIGIPLSAVLYGAEGALFAAIFDVGVNVTIWTVGIFLLTKRKKIFSIQTMKSMINMPMVAIVVGLGISIFHYQPPAVTIQLIEKLANIASPLAMIYIGLLIPILWKKRRTMSFTDLGIPMGIKLFLFPLIVTFCLTLLKLESIVTGVILVQCTMPVITMASILFAKSGANEELGAATTVYSTLLSMLTIPVMTYLCGQILGYTFI